MGRLSYRPYEVPGHFLLEERALRVGECLEVLTPLGWMKGYFYWAPPDKGWPLLVLPQQDDEETLLVILAPGTVCRRATDCH